MKQDISKFLRDETGAIASDWVVVAGLVLGVCFAIYTLVGGAIADHSLTLETTFATRGIPTY